MAQIHYEIHQQFQDRVELTGDGINQLGIPGLVSQIGAQTEHTNGESERATTTPTWYYRKPRHSLGAQHFVQTESYDALESLCVKIIDEEQQTKESRAGNILIHGMRAVGKTTIVEQLTLEHDRLWDHIIFINASSSEELKDDYQDFLKYLRLDIDASRQSDARSHFVFFDWLSRNKRWLLIYDDFGLDDARPTTDEYIYRAQGTNPGDGLVLIISSNPFKFKWSNLESLEVNPMTTPEALKYARKLLPDVSNDCLEAIVEKVGNHPFAIFLLPDFLEKDVFADKSVLLGKFMDDYDKVNPRSKDTLKRVIDLIRMAIHKVETSDDNCNYASILLQFLGYVSKNGLDDDLLKDVWSNFQRKKGQMSQWRKQHVIRPFHETNKNDWDLHPIRQAMTRLKNYHLIKKEEKAITVHTLIQHTVLDRNIDPTEKDIEKISASSVLITLAEATIREPSSGVQPNMRMHMNRRDVYIHLQACIRRLAQHEIHESTDETQQVDAVLQIIDMSLDLEGFLDSTKAVQKIALCYADHGPRGFAKHLLDKTCEKLKQYLETMSKDDIGFGRVERLYWEVMNDRGLAYVSNGDSALEIRVGIWKYATEQGSKIDERDLRRWKANLAQSYDMDGKLHKALELRAELCLAQMKPSIADLTDYAFSLRRLDRYPDARKLLEKEAKTLFGCEVESLINSDSSQHTSYKAWRLEHINMLDELSSHYYVYGQYDAALYLRTLVAKFHHETFGKYNRRTLKSIADILVTQSQLAMDVREQLHRVYERLKLTCGTKHRITLAVKLNLAICTMKYDHERAVSIARDVLSMQERSLRDGHPDTLYTRQKLAKLLLQSKNQDDHEESYKILQDILSTQEKIPDIVKSEIMTTRLRIAKCLYHLKQHFDAQLHCHEILKGEDSKKVTPVLLSVKSELSIVYLELAQLKCRCFAQGDKCDAKISTSVASSIATESSQFSAHVGDLDERRQSVVPVNSGADIEPSSPSTNDNQKQLYKKMALRYAREAVLETEMLSYRHKCIAILIRNLIAILKFDDLDGNMTEIKDLERKLQGNPDSEGPDIKRNSAISKWIQDVSEDLKTDKWQNDDSVGPFRTNIDQLQTTDDSEPLPTNDSEPLPSNAQIEHQEITNGVEEATVPTQRSRPLSTIPCCVLL